MTISSILCVRTRLITSAMRCTTFVRNFRTEIFDTSFSWFNSGIVVQLRTKDRIPILHKFINLWQIKIPQFIKDLSGGRIKEIFSIRIIFTKLSQYNCSVQNTFLIGGMTADVNRFQWNTLPNKKSLFWLSQNDIPY